MIQEPWMDAITVLKITQTSERFIKLDYISPTKGLTYGLLRHKAKNSTSAQPDLFDTAEILCEPANKAKQRFIKNYTPLKKRNAIGNHYQQLEYACHFSNFLLNNVSDVPDPSDLYSLTVNTLDAFEQEFAPQIILLKALYHFLKIEGFPINNAWWQSLSQVDQFRAKALLTTPLSEIDSNFDPNSAKTLYDHLCLWVHKETELKILKL
jgi:recombinational DNA repair protein (RecF pathway)